MQLWVMKRQLGEAVLEVLKGDAVSARTVQAAMLNAKPKMKQTEDNGNRYNWHW